MSKGMIEFEPEKCSGCCRCQLVCSEVHTSRSNPSAARIKLNRSAAPCSVEFTDQCSKCMICVNECLYGALKNKL